jgi:hypothetical protein
VHERVDVVGFGVEVGAGRVEVGAHIGGDLLAAGEGRVGARPTPVLGGEDRMCVQVVGNASAASGVRVGCPSR